MGKFSPPSVADFGGADFERRRNAGGYAVADIAALLGLSALKIVDECAVPRRNRKDFAANDLNASRAWCVIDFVAFGRPT